MVTPGSDAASGPGCLELILSNVYFSPGRPDTVLVCITDFGAPWRMCLECFVNFKSAEGKLITRSSNKKLKKIKTAPLPQIFPVVFFSASIPVTNIKGLEMRDLGAMRLMLAAC